MFSVGNYLSCMGVSTVICQITIYPALDEKLKKDFLQNIAALNMPIESKRPKETLRKKEL